MPSFGLSNARAEASRKNGAKSRGPKTPEGKARSAINALKHGFRAQKYVVLPDEDGAAFQALEAALLEELAPQGALQTVLARRVVAASWRLERAERLEAELFAENHLEGRSLGLALIRDGKGSRSFDTLMRYRGGTLAEFWRALRTLKALQSERTQIGDAAPACAQRGTVARVPAPTVRDRAPAFTAQPDEPESGGNPCDSARAGDRVDPSDPSPASAWLPPRPAPSRPAASARPTEPETRGQLVESAPFLPSKTVPRNGSASLLAGTASV